MSNPEKLHKELISSLLGVKIKETNSNRQYLITMVDPDLPQSIFIGYWIGIEDLVAKYEIIEDHPVKSLLRLVS